MRMTDIKENIQILEDIAGANIGLSKKAKHILKLDATTHNLSEMGKIIKEYNSLINYLDPRVRGFLKSNKS